jgi:hypothetical protein
MKLGLLLWAFSWWGSGQVADNPLSLRNGLSASRSVREPVAKQLEILPGGLLWYRVVPLHANLLDRWVRGVLGLVPSGLQNLHGDPSWGCWEATLEVFQIFPS